MTHILNFADGSVGEIDDGFDAMSQLGVAEVMEELADLNFDGV